MFNLYSLQNNPFIEFLAPFILVFAIIYAGLKSAHVFDGKNLNAVIAAAISFFAVAYPPFNIFLWKTMPYVAGAVLLLSIGLVFWNLAHRFTGGAGTIKMDNMFIGVNVAVLLILLSTYQNHLQLTFIDLEQVMWAIGIGVVLVVVAKAASKTEDLMEKHPLGKAEEAPKH